MSMFRRDEGGQSVVLIAVSLPLILSLLLLVIDGGRLYVERERIRNAAQLAAEAAVSLAADSPGGSRPKDADVRGIVAEALQRNLPGEGYEADVVMPFRTDITTFNVKVNVQKEFRASIAAVRFRIGADAAAMLGAAASAPPGSAPPVPTATPSPTPAPSATPTPTPRPTATPTPTPARVPVYVAVCIDGFDGGDYYGSSWRGRFLGGTNVLTAPAYRGGTPTLGLSFASGAYAATVSLSGAGTWNSTDRLTQYRGWGWSFGWIYQPGTYIPTVTLSGYPAARLPPLTVVKTSRLDYRCTAGWVQ